MSTLVSFPGFKRTYKNGYFKYPNELELYWHILSGSEAKLLTFILRRTYGFSKLQDYISISQFVDGVGKKGKGAGVSRAQVQRALKGLEEKGFICIEQRGYQTRLIKLVLRDEEVDEPERSHAPASDQVVYLISLFRDVSPHLVDGYMTSKSQIRAMERLLQHYGQDDIEGFVVGVRESFGKQYAPTIASPVELEKKLSQLIAYFKRKQSDEGKLKVSF